MNLRQENYNEMMKNFFPFTETCPQDSKACIKENCKYFISDKHCWDVEFPKMVMSIFEEADSGNDYIMFKNEDGKHSFELRHVHFDMTDADPQDGWAESKTKDKSGIKIIATIGFNGERLAKQVKEKFNLSNWVVKNVAYDGGDDTDLEIIIDGSYNNREEILRFMVEIKNMVPFILKYEKEVNTCQICYEKAFELHDYGKRNICRGCEDRIINENIEKYFKDGKCFHCKGIGFLCFNSEEGWHDKCSTCSGTGKAII